MVERLSYTQLVRSSNLFSCIKADFKRSQPFFVIEVGADLACIGWVTVYNSNMLLGRIVRFYVEGFRSMTLGRTLWGIILLKLFIMFAVLKAFFFPSYLQGGEQEKGDTVLTELTNRAAEEE